MYTKSLYYDMANSDTFKRYTGCLRSISVTEDLKYSYYSFKFREKNFLEVIKKGIETPLVRLFDFKLVYSYICNNNVEVKIYGELDNHGEQLLECVKEEKGNANILNVMDSFIKKYTTEMGMELSDFYNTECIKGLYERMIDVTNKYQTEYKAYSLFLGSSERGPEDFHSLSVDFIFNDSSKCSIRYNLDERYDSVGLNKQLTPIQYQIVSELQLFTKQVINIY